MTASLIYPQKALGKTFWDRVYSKAKQMYGTTQIPVNTFNKVWIVPQKAGVYEHGQTAYIVNAHLKVMLEEDYLSLNKHNGVIARSPQGDEVISNRTANDAHSIASQVIRQIILPEIEKEINEGQNFATLRQIFYAQVLAVWFKRNLKQALLNRVYANKGIVKGIDQNDVSTNEAIYQQYLKAYKKGVFNFIKEETLPPLDGEGQRGVTIARQYFSGGFADLAELTIVPTPFSKTDRAQATKDIDFAVMAVRPQDADMLEADKLQNGMMMLTVLLQEPHLGAAEMVVTSQRNTLLAQVTKGLDWTRDGKKGYIPAFRMLKNAELNAALIRVLLSINILPVPGQVKADMLFQYAKRDLTDRDRLAGIFNSIKEISSEKSQQYVVYFMELELKFARNDMESIRRMVEAIKHRKDLLVQLTEILDTLFEILTTISSQGSEEMQAEAFVLMRQSISLVEAKIKRAKWNKLVVSVQRNKLVYKSRVKIAAALLSTAESLINSPGIDKIIRHAVAVAVVLGVGVSLKKPAEVWVHHLSKIYHQPPGDIFNVGIIGSILVFCAGCVLYFRNKPKVDPAMFTSKLRISVMVGLAVAGMGASTAPAIVVQKAKKDTHGPVAVQSMPVKKATYLQLQNWLEQLKTDDWKTVNTSPAWKNILAQGPSIIPYLIAYAKDHGEEEKSYPVEWALHAAGFLGRDIDKAKKNEVENFLIQVCDGDSFLIAYAMSGASQGLFLLTHPYEPDNNDHTDYDLPSQDSKGHTTNKAMASQAFPGGIDLSRQDAALLVQKDANGGVKVNVDPALIARIEREGIYEVDPLIINMRPADTRAL